MKRKGFVLSKVTYNGKDYFAYDMPDSGWWIYPYQKYKIVIDNLNDNLFRVEYQL